MQAFRAVQRWFAALILTLAVTPLQAAPPAAGGWASRPEVIEFIREMVDKHGFDAAALTDVFERTRTADAALKLMTPAPVSGKRSWSAYRARFVEPIRIRDGLRFWREQADPIRRAADRFGVPQEIIVAIIGVETVYGRNTGDFRVMDALTTLAFDYPRRAPFFREELEQFLLLSRDNEVDPLLWRGSYAGAIGLPQFMPGSIRRHAIDFDGDGKIDLRTSTSDAVGSVARFLSNHGWRPGESTHFRALVDDEARARPAIDAGVPPTLSLAELAALGVSSPQSIAATERLSLIDLPDGDKPTQFVLGTNNFWVITRYNRSYFYAMSVIDLARALKDAANAPAPVQPGKRPVER
jgi:membrane-bound lytic murein transglycosylase B